MTKRSTRNSESSRGSNTNTKDQSAQPESNNARPEASSSGSSVPSNDAALGHAVWLMMNMPQYRHVFLADLEWLVLPPVMLGQYRLFRACDRAERPSVQDASVDSARTTAGRDCSGRKFFRLGIRARDFSFA